MKMKLNRIYALLVGLALPLIAFGQEVDQELLKLARKGDPKAMYEVGLSYFKKGDKKGFEDAYDWFLKSAEKDYGPSEVMTAYLLKTGIVKTDDPNGAWKWAQKALGEGDGLGAWLLAQICSERGFDKDIIYEYVEKASESNYPLAKFLMAKLYATGSTDYPIRMDITKSRRMLQEITGCEIPIVSAMIGAQSLDNPQLAFRHLKSAADSGIPAAMSQVANMYINGAGIARNIPEAFKYYQMAAEKNDPLGMEGLADCYRTGTGTGIFHERAFNLYKNLDSPRALYILGCYYNEGISVAKDQKKAVDLFQKAASKGNVFAQALLGTAYYDGSSPFDSKDFDQAYKYLNSAQKNKNFEQLPSEMASKVLECLARCFRFGRGGAPTNREEAERLQVRADALKKSVSSGNQPFASVKVMSFPESKDRCGITWDSTEYDDILGLITFDYPRDYLNSKAEPKKIVEAEQVTPPVEQKVEQKQENRVEENKTINQVKLAKQDKPKPAKQDKPKPVKQDKPKQAKQDKPAKLTPAKDQTGKVAVFVEAAPLGFGPSSIISKKDDKSYWLKGQVTEVSASVGWLGESGFIGGGAAFDSYSGGRMSSFLGFVDLRYTKGPKKSGIMAGGRAGVAYASDYGIGINAAGTLGYMISIGGIAIDLGMKAGITVFKDENKTKTGLVAPFVGICF